NRPPKISGSSEAGVEIGVLHRGGCRLDLARSGDGRRVEIAHIDCSIFTVTLRGDRADIAGDSECRSRRTSPRVSLALGGRAPKSGYCLRPARAFSKISLSCFAIMLRPIDCLAEAPKPPSWSVVVRFT